MSTGDTKLDPFGYLITLVSLEFNAIVENLSAERASFEPQLPQ